MQNTYLESAELKFWKVFTPLMYTSNLVKFLVKICFLPIWWMLKLIIDVLSGRLHFLYLFVVIVLGGAAFGIGYMLACNMW
jgi:hypothetical protein